MGRHRPASIPEDILARIQAGDADAMAVVSASLREFLVNYADRFTHDHYVSEDMVQDALMRLWAKACTIDNPARLASWLFRTTRNLAIDYVKSSTSRREKPDGWLLDTEAPDPHDGQTASVERMEWGALVSHLTPKQQACARLLSGGLSQSEVATALSIPEGTVKSRMHLAHRRAARMAIAEDWEEKVG